jgi:hypothetical protein
VEQIIKVALAVWGTGGTYSFPEIAGLLKNGWKVVHMAELTVPHAYRTDHNEVPESRMVFVLEKRMGVPAVAAGQTKELAQASQN